MYLMIAMVLALAPTVASAAGVMPELGGAAAAQSSPNARFITVEGGSLSSRIDAAISRGRAAGAERFWAAYTFDVRPGVAVDVVYESKNGSVVVSNFNVSTGGEKETRNLGIFALYTKAGGAPVRIEIYNLDRARDYDGLPVYWLGRAATDESLSLLERYVASASGEEQVERAVAAIAIHDGNRPADLLESIVRGSRVAKARRAAVTWVGITSGRTGFLAGIVRDASEDRELRHHAATAIGIGSAPDAISTLRGLYGDVDDRDVRQHILTAVAIHGDKKGSEEEAVDFLVEVATNEKDRDLRRHALFWLSQKAGKRGLEVITEAIDSDDEDVAEHAVFALGQRPKDEAIPALMNVARNHRSLEVRKKALFWLSQIDDDRVLAFFKEVLER
jgi:hypothetical protein